MNKELTKHCIVARDKETGEQRQFIFYGDWYNLPQDLLVEEVFRPMTDGEKDIAEDMDKYFMKIDKLK